MKCPLLHIKLTIKETSCEAPPQECLKEDCAWWDAGFEYCVLPAIRDDLREISGALQGILIKMPEGGKA